MDVGYEPDQHSRLVVACAVVGGVLALIPLLLFVTKPTMDVPAGVFSGGSGLSDAQAYQSVSSGFLFVLQILMLLVLCLAVRGRWLADPDAPVTRALAVMTSVLAVLVAFHVLVAVVQVLKPESRVPGLVATSMGAGLSALVLACLILGGDRLHRAREVEDDRRRRRDRHSQLLLILVCALPPIVVLVKLVYGMARTGADLVFTALISLPTTAIALWAVHRMQRHRRMPARILLAGFGWGAVVATGLGLALPLLYTTLSDQLLGY